MANLVLLRHGESQWNLENRFTGWTDVDLTSQGREEARTAAAKLKAEGFTFDCAYTSVQKRAIRTLWLLLDEMDLMWIPVTRSWRLNERHYGALQGLNKEETAKKFGDEQVHIWRRSYDTPPPALTPDDPRYPGFDPRYGTLDPKDLPLTESLKDAIARVMPYWHGEIAPALRAGRKVIVVSHGNSLRGLIKHLDHISDEKIADLNIPTGQPLVYALDDDLKPVEHHYAG